MKNSTVLINAIARTLFVLAWADWNDEYGNTETSGKELMDIAPANPEGMEKHGEKVLNGFLKVNNITLDELILKAEKTYNGEGGTDTMLKELGHCLAMAATGQGVSWEDDNNDMKLENFYYEYGMYDLPSEYPILDEDEHG